MGLFDFIKKVFGGGEDYNKGITEDSVRYGEAIKERDATREPKRVSDRKARNVQQETPSRPKRDLQYLANGLGKQPLDLQSIRASYHEFRIPKRSGGQRQIEAPSEDLKSIQRLVLRRILKKLRAHPAAHGFERDKSIVTNAAEHTKSRVVVKLDLEDFFNSTGSDRVQTYFERIGWKQDAARELTRLCTNRGRLPQGAPTSPRLSNLVNYQLDDRLARLARSFGGWYTRYADDITFSLDDRNGQRIGNLINLAKRILKEYGYKLHTDKKLHIMRHTDRQAITGLVVNERVGLPREIRRKLRAARHKMKTQGTCSMTQKQLDGWNALEAMVAKQST